MALRWLAFVFISLVAAICKADVILTNPSGASVTLTRAYSPQLASILNFAPRTGPVYFIPDACTADVNGEDIPIGSVVVYGRFECDEGLPLSRFLKFSNRTSTLVELWGTREAILEGGPLDEDPSDLPPRFLFDPRPASRVFAYVKVHSSDAGRAGQFIRANANGTVTASVSYTPDPWKAMYYTPQWIIYTIVSIFFFCFYIPQHAIRSLILLQRVRRKTPAHARSINIQTVMMSAAVALGVVKNVEIITQMLRDYGDVWSPEIVSQLAWGYGYYILLLSMMLLVLFWGDVLKTSRVKLNMLDDFSMKLLKWFGIVAFLVLTTFIFLFVYEVPGTQYVRSAGFLLLGSVALIEGIGSVVFGGRLLKQLTDVKPIADRGFQRSPSLANESELIASENPAFDPNMNRSSLPKAASPRMSLGRFNSTTKAMSSDDTEEKRKMRIAAKRAKPLTRLVVSSAALLLIATGLSGAASFTNLLNSPNTYIAIFLPLLACEITIYALIIHTMSPIWQERRRRFARSDSEVQLSPLSEEGPMSTTDADSTPKHSRVKDCAQCLRNWIVC